MAILITLSVVRGGGVSEVLTADTAQDIAFNTAFIANAQSLDDFTTGPSGARTTFRYADPSSGRGADQVDVTEPYSAVIAASNAPLA